MLTAHKLIAAVILPGLLALALACGPSAELGDDQPSQVEPTVVLTEPPAKWVKKEPTAPTETLTAKPASEPTDLPTPTAASASGTGSMYIEPMLQARIDQHKREGGSPQDTIAVRFVANAVGDDYWAGMRKLYNYLGDIGVTYNIEREGSNIPFSLFPTLIEHPDFDGAFLAIDEDEYPYPSLNRDLNNVIVAVQIGATPQEAAVHSFVHLDDKVYVVIGAADQPALVAVKRFLDNNNVYFNESAYRLHEVGDADSFGVLLPVNHLLPLYQMKDVSLWTMFDWERVPSNTYEAEELDWALFFLATALPPELQHTVPGLPEFIKEWQQYQDQQSTPPADSGNSEPATGASGAATGNIRSGAYVSAGVAKHGADLWHAAAQPITGSGVKVGIIDWSFTDFNKDNNPKLPALEHDTRENDGNAKCPRIGHDLPLEASVLGYNWELRTYPVGTGAAWVPLPRDPCQPHLIIHGVSIAEAVHDIAPDAELFMARATSPQEVRAGADWLINKGVDVIVHAAGWHYDGPGDGTSPFASSPLKAVDRAVAAGITWVNAAGNQALNSWFGTSSDYAINKVSSIIRGPDFRNLIVFNPFASTDDQKTCLPFVAYGFPISVENLSKDLKPNIYFYHLRWADDWSGADFDLDLLIDYPRTGTKGKAIYGKGYPVEAVKDIVTTAKPGSCLRVRINPRRGQPDAKPAWVQIQILNAPNNTAPGLSRTPVGYSVVNPAESANPGLIAVAAADVRTSRPIPSITDYSSRGPVLEPGTTGDFTRSKPDLVAASHVVNFLKRNEQGDDRYFGGTSAATAHVGGLAALVIQKMRLERNDPSYKPSPANVASCLKSYGEYPRTFGGDKKKRSAPNPPGGLDPYELGHGFVKLPPLADATRSGTPAKLAAAVGDKQLTVTWDPPVEDCKVGITGYAMRYKRDGATTDANPYQSVHGIKANARSHTITGLTNGADYTVQVWAVNSAGSGIANRAELTGLTPAAPRPVASLSPDPSGVDFRDDGQWHQFTVSASVRVRVVVNPTGSDRSLEIGVSDAGNYCPPEQNDGPTRRDGQQVYLAGCVAGSGVVELRRASDGRVIRTYAVTIKAAPAAAPPQECRPVSSFAAERTSGSAVRLTWQNPAGGLAAQQRRINIMKWSGGQWVAERQITVPAGSQQALHLGIDRAVYYAYTVRSECAGDRNSGWSSWETVAPFSGHVRRSGEEAIPTPTPVPGGGAGRAGDGPIELPPDPTP